MPPGWRHGSRVAAGPLLPRGVHLARRNPSPGTPEQTRGLRHPVSGGSGNAPRGGGQSQTSGRRNRLLGSAPHVGPESDAPPPRSLRRDRRRAGSRPVPLDSLPAEPPAKEALLRTGGDPQQCVSRQVHRFPEAGLSQRPTRIPRQAGTLDPADPVRTPTPHGRKEELDRLCQTPLRGPRPGVKYLARYTHRVAISNQRLVELRDGQVSFGTRITRMANRPKS